MKGVQSSLGVDTGVEENASNAAASATFVGSAPTVVDLFSGAGGFACGFERAGYRLDLAVDRHEPSIRTVRENHPGADAVCTDITRLDFATLPYRPDVLVAGIPCQGFSVANRKHDADDERNHLFRHFLRAVRAFDPDAILIENVSNMKSVKKGGYVHDIVTLIADLGYRVDWKVLNAAEFGVPQHRERLFIQGAKNAIRWPDPPGITVTAGEAFAHLPPVESGETAPWPPNHTAPDHEPSTVERIEGTAPGEPMYESFRQRVRLAPDEPAPTIVSGGIRPQFQYGHPTRPRGLTVRERAVLQSFSDHYRFRGGITQARVQTGQAVPPRLAAALAAALETAPAGSPPVSTTAEQGTDGDVEAESAD